MPVSVDKRIGYGLAVVAVFGAVGAAAPGPASAQGLLGAIFEALGGRPVYRPPVPAYADPLDVFTDRPGPRAPAAPYGHGRAVTYCARTCDGRYFPIQSTGSASPDEMCSAMCPASKTRTFYGSTIDSAVARDGTRYADLDNAYVYRDRIVGGCTCNGKDAFGLAPIEVATDPTLRKGDIVATVQGLMAYTPARTRRGAETANFTPLDRARLSRDLQSRLATVEVAKPE